MPDHTKLVDVITQCHQGLDELFLLHQEAVLLARKVQQLMGEPDLATLSVLAAVYAEAWEFDTAILLAERAVAMARQSGQVDAENQLGRRLEFYRKRMPPEIV